MSTDEMSSLEEAKQEGKKHYISAVPCKKHGHVGRRYVSNRNCVECHLMGNIKPDTLRGIAKANNEIRYDPGHPCSRGHNSPRYVRSGQCVECDNETSRKGHPRYIAKYERTRKHNLKSLYGMTPEQFDEMLMKQDDKCAICSAPFDSRKSAHVDHKHTTGVVRGILCTRCNMGIGYFRENVDTMANAIRYLQIHTSCPDE